MHLGKKKTKEKNIKKLKNIRVPENSNLKIGYNIIRKPTTTTTIDIHKFFVRELVAVL